MELDNILAELHEDIVEHNLAHVLVGGHLQLHDELLAVHVIICNPLVLWNELTSDIVLATGQVLDEAFKLRSCNEASRCLVIGGPASLVPLERPILQLVEERSARCLAEEGLEDDRDEEVEEDLANDDLEKQVERNSEACATALGPVD